MQLDSVDFLVEFCVNEISLEGLQGCPVNKLFDRFSKSSRDLASNKSNLNEIESVIKLFNSVNVDDYENFIWKLLKSRPEIGFYLKGEASKSSTPDPAGKKKSTFQPYKIDSTKIINNNGDRGFSVEYYYRKRVNNELIRDSNYRQCVDKFGSNLLVVADQRTRNRVLCPTFKNLPFENLNDLEYCVLEAIGRSRYEGMATIGDDGLATRFNIAPKQLHYILVNLESIELVKRQTVASEKKRLLVHLTRFAFKKKTLLETMCDYLMSIGPDRSSPNSDTIANMRHNLRLSEKKFKNLVSLAERSNIMERFTSSAQNSADSRSKSRPVRMVRLTEEYLKSQRVRAPPSRGDVGGGEDEDDEEDTGSSLDSIWSVLGTAQSNHLPLFAQIFAEIERMGEAGISLKQIGALFAFDFYKSRRMGNNLQAHPEIVTLMKETNKGKTKFQSIVLRKFLALKKPDDEAPQLEAAQITEVTPTPTRPSSDQLLILKRDGQPNQSIQALMSDRMLNRKNMVLDYLAVNKICTKYELTREIRTRERQQGLTGSIDSKTTRRMLISLEAENKLRTFEVDLKNVSYMCVRAIDVHETDEAFKNYCATFKRTFDSVDLKVKGDASISDNESNDVDPSNDSDFYRIDLTAAFIESIVSKLEVLTQRKRLFPVVPKFQKAIILHRFICYLLYFYNGNQQPLEAGQIQEVEADVSNLDPSDLNVVKSCELPKISEAYQPIGDDSSEISWQTFIPPLERTKFPNNDSSGCIVVHEIFSRMPVSIFCALVGVNYVVPGLVALLRHPQKRHILVKNLPPNIIAPLIYRRVYLHRLLEVLHLMASLGLVSLFDSPCKTGPQPANRDIQSRMVYVHRHVRFYDTSCNECRDWEALSNLNRENFAPNVDSPAYAKIEIEFNSPDDVVRYWRRLFEISMNTFKFSVAKHLHENKSDRNERIVKRVCKARRLEEIPLVWPIESYGDHMGPGGYDSQLFLNSYKNWNASIVSESSRTVNKEPELVTAPCSELAMSFSLGSRFFAARAPPAKLGAFKKGATRPAKRKRDDSDESATKKTKRLVPATRDLKIQKAKYLVEKATKLTSAKLTTAKKKQNKKKQHPMDDRRATWKPIEDELILLVKVAHLYFLPNEKSVPFKLITDVANIIIPPSTGLEKKTSSFGRRIKLLLKSRANQIYVSNKLELCRQDKTLAAKYAAEKALLKTTPQSDRHPVDLYVAFIRQVKDKFLRKKSYELGDESEPVEAAGSGIRIELPETMDEFRRKYKILNTHQRDMFSKPQSAHFKQPTTDYEITCNTVHNAIHSSILINDKTPREYESRKVFEKYSDHLLTDVIQKMSRQHKIIAPTKLHEIKKKNVTAFSQHIGKAYHISQRYQYKWTNVISPSVIDETNKFKNELVNFKLEQLKRLETDKDAEEEMFDCTDKDDIGMTSFLAHTIDNADLQVQIDVPNKIWVSKLI